jgi:hypothetical protein
MSLGTGIHAVNPDQVYGQIVANRLAIVVRPDFDNCPIEDL